MKNPTTTLSGFYIYADPDGLSSKMQNQYLIN